MLVEIDTRTIQGYSGEVCWQLDDGVHIISVVDSEGTVRACLHAVDGLEARELFEHPFAAASVPNLFDRSAVPA